MIRPLCCLWWCLASATLAASDRPAVGPYPEPERAAVGSSQESRFLLVVDTSAAMRQFKHEGRQFVFDLLYTDLAPLMQPGDTYGVWTFNQEVSGGVFPMQVWQPQQKLELTSKATLFLAQQRYEKTARLGPVWTKLLAQINAVRDVNVLIITSGQAQLGEVSLGETFRRVWEVKAALAQNFSQPMVIALAARKGQIVNWAISTGNEPLVFPHPPAPLAAAPPAPPPKTEKPAAPAAQALATNQIPRTTNEPPPGEAIKVKADAAQTPAPVKSPATSLIIKGPQPLMTNAETPVPAAISSGKSTNTAINARTNFPLPSTPAQTSAPALAPAIPSEPPATSPPTSTLTPRLPPLDTAPSGPHHVQASALDSIWYWAGGAGLLTVLGVVAGLWRRARRRVRTTFITRSMER